MDLNYSEIGARIARRRRQLGMKQFEVEEKADISYKYLSNIERGISIPSLEVLMRFYIFHAKNFFGFTFFLLASILPPLFWQYLDNW